MLLQILGRLVSLGVGGAALYFQIQLVEEFYRGASPIMIQAIPLLSVALALSAAACEFAVRARHFGKAIAIVLVFGLLMATTLTGTLGRMSEFRATKTSEATRTGRAYDLAAQALKKAEDAEAEARTEILTCKGKTCEFWSAELERRRVATTQARADVADAPAVPAAAPEVETLHELTGIPKATIARWQPNLFPLGLAFIELMGFWLALSPVWSGRVHSSAVGSSRVQSRPDAGEPVPAPQAEPLAAPAPEVGVRLPQDEVTALVRAWEASGGIPANPIAVGQAFVAFEAWAKSPSPISLVAFGQALTAAGVKKTKLQGRVMIQGRRSA